MLFFFFYFLNHFPLLNYLFINTNNIQKKDCLKRIPRFQQQESRKKNNKMYSKVVNNVLSFRWNFYGSNEI